MAFRRTFLCNRRWWNTWQRCQLLEKYCLSTKVNFQEAQRNDSTASDPTNTHPRNNRQLLKRSSPIWEDYWQSMLGELRSFVQKEGHAKLPANYAPSPALSRWVDQQRQEYKLKQQGKPHSLTPQRLAQLEEVGMVWSVYQDSWEEAFAMLHEYYRRNGHSNVSMSEGGPLPVWVQTQRRQYRFYKEGRPSSMTEERMARLDEVNFQWDMQEAVWMERYQELCRYREAHGDCIVPKFYESNPDLGQWVRRQREQYTRWKKRRHPFSMTQERVDLLEKIDFVWNVYDAIWKTRFAELEEFVQVNGNGAAPPAKTHAQLVRWLNEQRRQHQKMLDGENVPLTGDRIAMLQRLGFTLLADT